MEHKKVLAIIPARGGSKGVPNKNLKLLRGKPLVNHAIEYAKSVHHIDKIVVSTDSDDIASVALKQGVNVVKRPDLISGDRSLVIDAIKHVLDELEKKDFFLPEIIVLLECTSPIKRSSEIYKAIEILSTGQADSVATFKETSISPNRIWKIEDQNVKPYNNNASPFLPRQSQPKGYELTGQIYAVTAKKLIEDPNNISILVGKVFPIITETEVVDIDTELDFIIAEEIMKYLETKK